MTENFSSPKHCLTDLKVTTILGHLHEKYANIHRRSTTVLQVINIYIFIIITFIQFYTIKKQCTHTYTSTVCLKFIKNVDNGNNYNQRQTWQ